MFNYCCINYFCALWVKFHKHVSNFSLCFSCSSCDAGSSCSSAKQELYVVVLKYFLSVSNFSFTLGQSRTMVVDLAPH